MSILGRLPRGARAPLAAALAVVLLLTSMGVALRQDPFAFLFPFGRGPGLDYSGPEAGFVPLDAGFVSDALGEPVGETPSAGSQAGVSRRRSGTRSIVDPHPLTNDDMADARHVSSIPYTARTDASDATRETSEPTDCGDGGGTVWYRYTAGDEGALLATVGTDSDFALTGAGSVTLGVFRGEGFEVVRCDGDRSGRLSANFIVEPGETYLFQIAGAGPLVFGLRPPPAMQLVSTTGRQGEYWDPGGSDARLSGDGRIVVYQSGFNSNLGRGDVERECWLRDPHEAGAARTGFGAVGNCQQILAHDRATGETVAVSVSSDGDLGNGASRGPDISADGRYVVFESWATNLVPDDTNRVADIFLHDLVTRKTERLSVNSRGEQTLGASFEAHSFMATISDDGNRIAFASAAPNLVDDISGRLGLDVYVRDRIAGTTELVSVPLDPDDPTTWPDRMRDGVQTADDFPLYDEYMLPCISPDGMFVAFKSHAPDLVEGDTNGYADWFVRDLAAGVTERISVATDGTQGDHHAAPRDHAVLNVRGNCFSADDRYVVFESEASNLVGGDTNERVDGFVRDRLTGTTIRVTLDETGEEFPRESHYTTISRDGRWIAFLGSDRARIANVVETENAYPGGIRFGTGYEARNPRGLHIRDMRTGRVEWFPLVSGERKGDGHWFDLSSDGRIVALDTNFPVWTEDSSHPSWYVGCQPEHDLIYERFGEGCFDASIRHVYVVERWEAGR